MNKPYILYILLCSPCIVKAQNEWANWNSSNGGITFKNGNGVIYSDIPKDLSWPDYTGQKAYSYSNPLTGDMLFLTDGKSIWNKNYKSIISPNSLISCDSNYYNVQIVPFANDSTKFYLFHLYSSKVYLSEEETWNINGCFDQSFANLYYSVLQMDFNKNTGKLITSNTPILKNPLDRVALVRHGNNRDTWVISHPRDSSYYVAYLVTDTLVHDPVISKIGPSVPLLYSPLGYQNIRSCITTSPDGSIIAAAGSATIVEIYDFDKNTGILSNYRTVNLHDYKTANLNIEYITSLCFSPDNTKLYIASRDSKYCREYDGIYQVDLTRKNLGRNLFLVKQISAKRIIELTMAKDNRIWIKGAEPDYLSVIEYPNQPKNACTFKGKYLKIKKPVTFPKTINDYIEQAPEKPIKKLNLPDTLKVCFGKTTLDAGRGYESYKWNTGEITQAIEVTKPGLYTVLVGKKNFSKPQAYGYVYVQSTAAKVFDNADTIFCPKTLPILKVPGTINNILWMDGDTRREKPVNNDKYKLTGIDNNGCKVWDSICVSIQYDPVVFFGNDTTICSPRQLKLTMKNYVDSASRIYIQTSRFLWQDGSTKESFRVNKSGTFWGSTTFEGCTVSDTINVNYVSLPQAHLARDTNLCEGDSLLLSVESSDASYLWNTGSTANAFTVYKTGKYSIKVSKDICVNSDSIDVKFKPLPSIVLPKDTVLCEGTVLDLSSLQDSSYTYKWQGKDTCSRFIALNPGTYFVAVNLNGCSVSDSIKIGIMHKPAIHLSDSSICPGTSMVLNPGTFDNDALTWQDGSKKNTFIITTPGVYSVDAINKCGRDFKQITVTSKLCMVMMPTAFTPNGDNKNDFFRIKYPDLVKTLHMVVYNKMGQKIFETTDPYKGWDGTIKGLPQPMDTYIWQIEYTDMRNSKESLNGFVVLIR
jgi:gliding motility-associated-like protein